MNLSIDTVANVLGPILSAHQRGSRQQADVRHKATDAQPVSALVNNHGRFSGNVMEGWHRYAAKRTNRSAAL